MPSQHKGVKNLLVATGYWLLGAFPRKGGNWNREKNGKTSTMEEDNEALSVV